MSMSKKGRISKKIEKKVKEFFEKLEKDAASKADIKQHNK